MFRMKRSTRWASSVGVVVLFLVAAALPALPAEPPQSFWDWATGPSIYDEDGKRDWGVEVTPYLWLAGLSGEMALPMGGSFPIDASFSSLADNLDAGFAGVLDLRYRRWHLISDNSWVRLEFLAVPDQPALTSAVLKPSIAFGTVGIAYELPLQQSYAVDVYLAARWWHLATDATITTGKGSTLAGSLSTAWADAVVGTRIRYSITDHWRVGAQADIGGGDASLDWSVFANVGYDFNRHVGMLVGYRVLGVDYRNAGVVYDVSQSGLLLGLTLRY